MSKCIGCGIIKQTNNQNQAGYVVKSENQYCLRCFKIKHYNQLIPQEIHAERFNEKLTDVIKSHQDQLIEFYYILDIFDLQASRVQLVEQAIKNFKVNIVINKIDLLPKAVKLNKIRKYVTNLFQDSDLANANIILNTSFKQDFINSLLNKVKKTPNVVKYFIGSSNVGKSSIINAMLQANNLVPQIVVSNYFNTTLDFIEIKLDAQTKFVDTPGIARTNSIANLMPPKDWSFIYFSKEVKQITYQLKPNNSIFFAGLCWVDFLTDENKITSFHVFTNRGLKLHRTNSLNANHYYQKNQAVLVPVIINQQISQYVFKFTKQELGKEYDLVIAGLGWINFKVNQSMQMIVNIPNDHQQVQVTLRKPLI